jgi:(2Fe-2S) ferredoxin
VPLGVAAVRHADELRDLAMATGASLAFLQVGSPSVTDELDRLHAAGVTHVELVGLGLGAPTARSWLRRVAGHWRRAHPEIAVVVSGRGVTVDEALTSPAWEQVPGHRTHALVCRGPRCSARGAGAVDTALGEELRAHNLGDDDVLVTQTGCLFPCNHAPVVVVHPDDVWYGAVDAAWARRLVAEHLVAGEVVEEKRLPRGPGDR